MPAAPLVNAGNGKLYICNQFAGTVSELDKNGKNVVRTVKVLREPKSAVFDKEGNTCLLLISAYAAGGCGYCSSLRICD